MDWNPRGVNGIQIMQIRQWNTADLSDSAIKTGIYASVFTAFLCTCFPLVNTDIWWHLAAGKQMIASRSFIFRDPFSVSGYGKPWINLHWLFQLVMYLTDVVFGIKGIVFLKSIVFALAGFVLIKIHYRKNTVWAALSIFLIFCYFMRFQILARPTVYTLLFISLFLFVLERYRNKKNKALWLLVPIQILWVNFQGLFILGPVILLCYITGDGITLILQKKELRFLGFRKVMFRHLRTMVYVLLGILFACLINPYGYRAFVLPFSLFGRIASLAHGLYSFNICGTNSSPLFFRVNF